MSVEQVTQDWSRTNYSSARASLAETWKTLMRRRADFCTNTATPWYATWLWEAMDRGQLPLPAGAPAFVEAQSAYAGAKWLGPARGYIDGVVAEVHPEQGVTVESTCSLVQGIFGIGGETSGELVMGVKAGADLATLLPVLHASSSNSFVLERFFARKALRGDFAPGGSIDIVAKDLELALAVAGEHRVPAPMAGVGYQLYALLRGQGHGGRDFSSVITLAEESAGVQARLP